MSVDALDLGQDQSTADLFRAFYEVDWADRLAGQRALGRVRGHLAADFVWLICSRHPPLSVSADELDCAIAALEADFLNCRFSPSTADRDVETVTLTGWVTVRTRHSRQALRRPFTDVWNFEYGEAARLEST